MMNKQFLMADHKWMNEKYIYGKMICIWGHKAQLYHYAGRGRGGRGRGEEGRERRGDKKNNDAHWDILKRTPKRWPTSCLVGMDWMFFSRKSNTISFHKFWFKTLKDTAIAPTVDLFRLNTLTGTKTAFLTPKSTLYMGVPQINVANCKLTTTTVKTISML